MGVYPAHAYRRVVYTQGDEQCVETRCPRCYKPVFFIVRTHVAHGQMSWTLRENDSQCGCDLSDADRQWLELTAIETSPDDTEDEEWYSLPHRTWQKEDGEA